MKWKFPGGKIKPGETPEHCLCREIAEELAIEVVWELSCPMPVEMFEENRRGG